MLPLEEALALAQERKLDLVCVSPQSIPPVCRVLDFGKYKYETAKRERDSKKKAHTDRLKEIKIRPRIEDNDYAIKLKKSIDFLQKGFKLRLTLMFRGREMTHQEIGFATIGRLIEDLKEYGTLESDYRKMGRRVTCLINPRPTGVKKESKKQGEGNAQTENSQSGQKTL